MTSPVVIIRASSDQEELLAALRKEWDTLRFEIRGNAIDLLDKVDAIVLDKIHVFVRGFLAGRK
jgi:hypothetical protein